MTQPVNPSPRISKEDGTRSALEFSGTRLVECPNCKGRAVITPLGEIGRERLTCLCGARRESQREPLVGYRRKRSDEGRSQSGRVADQILRRQKRDGRLFLGQAYFDGKGVVRDLSRAVNLINSACNFKSGAACEITGNVFAEGRYVAKDPVEATKYFKYACEDGIQSACERGR